MQKDTKNILNRSGFIGRVIGFQGAKSMTNTVNENKVTTQKIVEIFNTGDLSEVDSLTNENTLNSTGV